MDSYYHLVPYVFGNNYLVPLDDNAINLIWFVFVVSVLQCLWRACFSVVIWLNYCRYGLKHHPFNKSGYSANHHVWVSSLPSFECQLALLVLTSSIFLLLIRLFDATCTLCTSKPIPADRCGDISDKNSSDSVSAIGMSFQGMCVRVKSCAWSSCIILCNFAGACAIG